MKKVLTYHYGVQPNLAAMRVNKHLGMSVGSMRLINFSYKYQVQRRTIQKHKFLLTKDGTGTAFQVDAGEYTNVEWLKAWYDALTAVYPTLDLAFFYDTAKDDSFWEFYGNPETAYIEYDLLASASMRQELADLTGYPKSGQGETLAIASNDNYISVQFGVANLGNVHDHVLIRSPQLRAFGIVVDANYSDAVASVPILNTAEEEWVTTDFRNRGWTSPIDPVVLNEIDFNLSDVRGKRMSSPVFSITVEFE